MQSDLRSFLAGAGARGLVSRPDGAVSLMEIPERMEAAGREGKIFLAEQVEGFEAPLVYNLLGSQELLALALGCGREDAIRRFIAAGENLIEPVLVENAPVQERVFLGDEADVSRLPLIVHSKKDAGRYISAGLVVAKDPDTGVQNVSFNRMQLKGARKLGIRMMPSNHLGMMQQKYEERNRPMQVAVVLGDHPCELIAASSSPRYGVDEFTLASGLRGEALEMTKCKTVDLAVPARAEIVIEGEVLPRVREAEGPFGDFMGYYVPVMENHVVRVTAVTMREGAIFQTMKAGSEEDSRLLGLSREAAVLKAVEAMGAKVRALSLSPMIFNCAISIEQRFEGEAKNVILAAMGAYPWLKVCVVVDHDVDVFDKNDIWWAIGTRLKPETGVVQVNNAFGLGRDPYRLHQSKLGLDCTIPLGAWDEFERITIPRPGDGIGFPV